jgi:hypothetical protein
MVGRKKIGTAVNAACRENFSRASLGTRAIGSEAVPWKLVLKHAQSVSPLLGRESTFSTHTEQELELLNKLFQSVLLYMRRKTV